MDLDRFVGWLGGLRVPKEQLPVYRAAAERILKVVGDGPLWPKHIDAVLKEEEAAGASPKKLANYQRIGDLLLQFQTESAAPAPALPAPPIVAPIREPSSSRVIGALVVVIGLIWGGWTLYRVMFVGAQDAVFEGFNSEQIFLRFVRNPSSGDRRSVRVRISGFALPEEQSFDWDYIVHHATVPKGTPGSTPAGARDDWAIPDPAADPPLGVTMSVGISLPLKKELRDPDMKDFLLRARLEWAGHQQDFTRHNLRGGYHEVKK